MKHVYFNDLTLADTDADIIRQLDSFRALWKTLVSTIPLKNNLFSLPTVVHRLITAVGTIGSGKIGSVRKETMQSFILGSFHPKPVPIDDEPDSSPETVSRFLSSKWSVQTETGHKTACLMLAWSHLRGSLTIGFRASGIWERSVRRIEETMASGKTMPRTAVCISRPEHLSAPVVRRWLYCFAGSEYATEHTGFSYAMHGHKHFKLASCCGTEPEIRDWVKNTSSPGEAQFRPGLRPDSPEIANFVRKALTSAFDSGLYAPDEINGHEIDIGDFIGAANGKETTRIRIYVTEQNELHIRPKE